MSDGDALPIRKRADSERDLDRNSFLVLANKLLEERLTQKQKYILEKLSSETDYYSPTSFTKAVSVGLGCSESAVWNNLNGLKRCGLVESNGFVRLSSCAKTLMEAKKWNTCYGHL